MFGTDMDADMAEMDREELEPMDPDLLSALLDSDVDPGD